MREITLGPSLGESYLVEQGLAVGEIVAVSGAFNIDASAQLEGKPSMMSPSGGPVMTGHNHGGKSTESSEASDHSEYKKKESSSITPEQFRIQLAAVLKDYVVIKNALIKGDNSLAKDNLDRFNNSIQKVDMKLLKGNEHMTWMGQLKEINSALKSLKDADDIEESRLNFSKLSEQIIIITEQYKPLIDNSKDVYKHHCPMANGGKGANWLSFEENVRNPYFGDKMLKCGNSEKLVL